VERARTKTLTAEEIMEHVGRMGGSSFEAAGWDIELQPGAGMGFSLLHKVRRSALEALEDRMLASWSERRPINPSLVAPVVQASSASREPLVAVRVMDPALVDAVFAAGADEVHVPVGFGGESHQSADEKLVLELPRIVPDAAADALLSRIASGTRVLATTVGLLLECAAKGAKADAHWSLNVANPWTAEYVSTAGARTVWLSPELRLEQVSQLVEDTSASCGVAVYGRQELMVSQHCVLSIGGCDRNCVACERRQGWHRLRDEKGYEFPVTSDRYGRSHIVNSVPLDMTASIDKIMAAGVGAVRVDLTIESVDEVQEIVGRVREAIRMGAAGLELPERGERTTTGHFFRGVQ
jgi:putative protease